MKSIACRLLTSAIAFAWLTLLVCQTLFAQVVNHSGDLSLPTGASACDVLPATAGNQCTLRAAIELHNIGLGAGLITRAPGVTVINPAAPLPAVIRPGLRINGFLGNNRLELDGSSLPPGSICLNLQGGGMIITGLVINGCGTGISINTSGGNTIDGNYIGTNAAGNQAQGNGVGVAIQNVGNNRIGLGQGLGNVISGNTGSGVLIVGADATNNIVQNNLIGTNVNGGTALENGNGVRIQFANNNTGPNNTVRDNVISGNNRAGVSIENSGNNIVQNNLIGTDGTGTLALGNSSGVIVFDASNNIIGGDAARDGNLISANKSDGILIQSVSQPSANNLVQRNLIGTNFAGSEDLGNHRAGIWISGGTGNVIGGPDGLRNVISGNYFDGIKISGQGATGNRVENNFIGTDLSGLKDVGNSGFGVLIEGASDNIIGGTANLGNIISGNYKTGIKISGKNASKNKIQSNFVGTDRIGTTALGNHGGGVWISWAPQNLIGGAGLLGNIISGNFETGIKISGKDATENIIENNYIGTDLFGTTGMGNSEFGILIDGAPGNTIGGLWSPPLNPPLPNPLASFACAGLCNLISDNGIDGVMIGGSDARGNAVLGNFIGTDVTGKAALGNGQSGVTLSNAPDNIVGGPRLPQRRIPLLPRDVLPRDVGGNLISANFHEGILIRFAGSQGNQVKGNLIGTASDSTTALANASHGIYITSLASQNIVGAAPEAYGGALHPPLPPSTLPPPPLDFAPVPPDPLDRNIVAFNGGEGVMVDGGTNNSILCNAIFSNRGLGIDLGPDGVTANDAIPGDPDTGANNLLNFPVLNTLKSTIGGVLNSTPDTLFLVEFYGNATCDPSTYGEGQVWLGYFHVQTNAGGNATFLTNFTGNNITATTTDPNGNTSEFSRCVSTVIQIDYGDAPAPYPTTTAAMGAYHNIINYLYLGNGVDTDWEGQPDATATGDDADGSDDEDGVVFSSALTPGSTASITITASGKGLLNAWLDFNADGDWDDPGEKIFADRWIFGPAIDNTLEFAIPVTAKTGPTFARFRFSTQPSLNYIMGAPDGEVEDYLVKITDLDTDSDKIPDRVENVSCTSPFDSDTDDDGIPDGLEDANHNGVLDSLELNPCSADSDGDGIQDGTELGLTERDIGLDTDTNIFIPDADPSTTTNPDKFDTDGDHISDGIEDINRNGRIDPWEPDPNQKTFEIPADQDNDGDIDGEDISLYAGIFNPATDQAYLETLAAYLGLFGLLSNVDGDGVLAHADFSGVSGDAPCTAGIVADYDDN